MVARRQSMILVRGAGDVASAVAHALFRDGWTVVLHEVPEPTTPRRRMAFAEAAFTGVATVDGVTSVRAETLDEVDRLVAGGGHVPLFTGNYAELRDHLRPSVLVDARLRKRLQPERLLGEAVLTVGLGPGFRAPELVDLAVETNWGPNLGAVFTDGETEAYTGEPRAVLGWGRERYLYAPHAGRFTTSLGIGDRVDAGRPVGAVDGATLIAQIDGVIRGITRSGLDVAAGTKLVDVDPRGEEAVLDGIGERPRRIANALTAALAEWHERGRHGV